MKTILIASAAAAMLSSSAAGADPLIGGHYRIRAGLGAQVEPSFPGSGSLDLLPFPKISVARDDKPFGFSAHDDSFGLALVSTHGFSLGPAANLRDRRRAEDVGAPVCDVSRAVEVGGFVQKIVGDSFRIRAELRKGVSGHSGLIGSAGGDWVTRDGDRYLFSIGPRVRFANASFMRTYFGVTPAAAAASPLPPYRPSGGIYGVGATSGFNYALGGKWGLFGFAEYTRLVGPARKSPIVRQLGSADQFAAGAGISYTFGLTL